MARCPVCRARMGGMPLCRRCGCDLTLVSACHQEAEHLLQRALHRLLQGDLQQAGFLAAEAASLDSDETVRKIAAFILHSGKEASGHSMLQGIRMDLAGGQPMSTKQA